LVETWLDQVAAARPTRNKIVHNAWIAIWTAEQRWAPAWYRLGSKRHGNTRKIVLTKEEVTLQAPCAMTDAAAALGAGETLPQHLRPSPRGLSPYE